MISMYSWIVGRKEEEEKEEEAPPPPPELIKEEGYYKGQNGSNDIKICWKDYDKQIKDITGEIKEMKKTIDKLDTLLKEKQDLNNSLLNLNNKWEDRLSPPELKRSITKKKKKKNNK